MFLDFVFIYNNPFSLPFCLPQNINPLIAKKMQEDRGREYMNARRVTKEYEVVTKGLNRNAPSIPPQNTPDESKQVTYSMCSICPPHVPHTCYYKNVLHTTLQFHNFFKVTGNS